MLQQSLLCREIVRVTTNAREPRFRFFAPLIAFACLVSWLATSSAALAQNPDETKPVPSRQWALLIGVEKYDRAPQLRHTVNDVVELAKTLNERGGLGKNDILEITDDSPDPSPRPLKASLLAELPKWLNKLGPNDQILVYFSGHGFRDKGGKLYLAPKDVDPADPATTGIPVEWFREQIAACPASFKLLILDACHAGSEKGVEPDDAVTAKDLGDKFQGMQKVVTLASCSANEKSRIWEENKQSLFSYWLNQGLKGHADENDDGMVDIHELYGYVSRTVKHTAKMRFDREQTPTRIIGAGIDGIPSVVKLKPLSLKQVLGDIAEQLAFAAEEHRIPKVGILEFINDTRVGELLGADFGLLGRYCSGELEERLYTLGAQHNIRVVDRRRLLDALRRQPLKIGDLAKTDTLKDLSAKIEDGMPAIALGTLQSRNGRIIRLRCKLVKTDSDDLVGTAGGTAVLNEDEWAMIGRSVDVRLVNRPAPAPPVPGVPVAPAANRVFQQLDQLAQGPHPLLDASFPFRVWIKAGSVDATGQQFNGEERKLVFRGNDCYLPVRKEEVLQIWLENKSGQLVLMRLLVDGLNTLPEKVAFTPIENGPPTETAPSAPWMMRSQQVVLEDGKPKGIQICEWGAQVNLSEARAWVLDPNDPRLKGGPSRWVVNGFVTKTGEDGLLRRFKVVDADQSLAARRQFTDQLGLITAAFYAPAGNGRGPVGIWAGPEMKQNLKEHKAPPVGNLLGVVHIRYVDADTLK